MVTDNTTLDYYNKNSLDFVLLTRDVDFREIQNKFLAQIASNGSILDLGCGSGRDTKYFLSKGYAVEAWDGSIELCKAASEFTQIDVKNKLFQELSAYNFYDGIWACSSILHLPLDELILVMTKIESALKNHGILYTSFKYGEFSGERNGRYFTDMTEDIFDSILQRCPHFQIIEIWKTGDVRPGRHAEQWLNILLRKIN
ncbi:class I SAM-dependent methyltransferase [Anaerovibrio slackiae]|uniref:class I SAM-dependent methyltransferase n=1 Tax=Anaerovibrio slackiae TaxID=2652309 RepID=UPI00386361BD